MSSLSTAKTNTTATSELSLRSAGIKGLLIATVIAAVGLASWWFLSKHPSSSPQPASSVQASTESTAPSTSAPTDLAQAEAYLTRGAIYSPPGANAVESYLASRQDSDLESRANAALWELLPMLDAGAKVAADSADWTELERIVALIESVDPQHLSIGPLLQRAAEARSSAAVENTTTASPPVANASASDPATVVNVAAADSIPATPATPPLQRPGPDPRATGRSDSREAAVATRAAPNQPVDNPAEATQSTAPNAEPRPEASSPSAVAESRSESIAPVTPDVPKLIRDAQVRYPPRALQQRIEGWVELEFTVTRDGRARDVRVVSSQPSVVFDREALTASARWRFENRASDYQGMRRKVQFRLPG